MRIVVLLCLLIGVAFETVAGSLTIVGNPGPDLSSSDIEEIKRLANAEGGEPWLFIGVGGQLGLSQIVRVFCEPPQKSEMVRRGSLVHISRQRPSRDSQVWNPWKLLGSEFYAQVKLEGREFGHVKDNRDNNRPFSVVGKFSDEELIELVTLVRSSPTFKPPVAQTHKTPNSTQVKGTLPIWYIHRKDDGHVEVNLLDGRSRGQTVRLTSKNGKWSILAVGMWIS